MTSENLPPLTVLSNINFHLDRGDSAAVTGPSGSGKSTLLNIIGALDRTDSGQVIINGKDLSLLNEKELGKLRNQSIGFVFQKHYLLPQLTVLENVLVPTLAAKDYKKSTSENCKNRKKEDLERAKELLSRVKLNKRLTHRPGRLSGGECQRVALIRALINRPDLLLADEPTGSLDRHASESLMELLLELNRTEKVTLILVTHALDISSQMNHVYELNEGEMFSAANRVSPDIETGEGRT